jgi:hypothetical protein
MLCIAIGGKLFDLIGIKMGEEAFAGALCSIAAVSLVIPVVSNVFMMLTSLKAIGIFS